MNKTILNKIFNSALNGANPKKCILESVILKKNNLKIQNKNYNLNKINKIFVISFGKSSIPMAEGIKIILKNKITEGLIISNENPKNKIKNFNYIKSSHPIPNKYSLMAAKKVIKLLSASQPKDLIIFLISGGGSSLVAAPEEGMSLKEKQIIFDRLLRSGLDIKMINFIRKKISSVKGGKLLMHSNSINICNILISDVIDGKPSDIASGPSVKELKTDLKLKNKVLKSKFVKSELPNINKIVNKKLLIRTNQTVRNFIVADNKKALDFAQTKAKELGYKTILYSFKVQGEASDIGSKFAKKVIDLAKKEEKGKKPICFLFGGESTVNVKGSGIGGRNMELALSFAIGISGNKKISALFAGTDGIDGNTNSAGAFCDSKTTVKASKIGISPKSYLINNDSYSFFKKLKDLKITGSTGCNVNDIGIILIDF